MEFASEKRASRTFLEWKLMFLIRLFRWKGQKYDRLAKSGRKWPNIFLQQKKLENLKIYAILQIGSKIVIFYMVFYSLLSKNHTKNKENWIRMRPAQKGPGKAREKPKARNGGAGALETLDEGGPGDTKNTKDTPRRPWRKEGPKSLSRMKS